MEKEQTMTPQEFDHMIKHVIPADQRKQWAEENKHRVVYPKPTLVQIAAYKWARESSTDSWKKDIKKAFEAGCEYIQKQSSKQWTDEEVNSLISYLSKYSWGHYDPVAGITKWWESYKENRGK